MAGEGGPGTGCAQSSISTPDFQKIKVKITMKESSGNNEKKQIGW